MKSIRLTLGILASSIGLSSGSWAEPSTGFLYGTGAVSNSYLQYACEGSTQRLTCKFTQMMLTPKLKESDYYSELEKKREQAEEEAVKKGGLDVMHEELCRDFLPHLDTVDALISGNIEGLPASVRDNYYSMSKGQLEANKDQFSALIEVCRSKPSDWLEKIFRSELDKSIKTCSLVAKPYEVTFQETSPGVYTSRNGPEGPCGVVSVNVFTPDDKFGFFYNYREQRVVTNKSSSIPLVLGEMKCSDLDESSLEFNWNNANEFKNCVYVTGP
jgi:hypothetical protein